MGRVKLSFNARIDGKKRVFNVEAPCREGVVITNEFCPIELLEGSVELLAAIRGVSINRFREDCQRQVLAMSNLDETDSEIDRHIGGLMAVVMDHLSRNKKITMSELLNYVDSFSLLLKGSKFDQEEIHALYPRIISTIQNLYPSSITK